MLAAIGAAGLWTIQQWGRREEQRGEAAAPLQAAARVQSRSRACDDRLAADQSSPTCKGRRPLSQQHGRSSAALKDGSLVCFQDRTGQVAVVQPYGSGASWRLAVTCASGGCCMLPHGVGSLSHLRSDAVFLVRQVGSNFAFLSLGAEGRYLAAVRDINAPVVLDSMRLTPAGQWRVSPGHQGISNAHHTHKKLAFTIHELKAVSLESIGIAERGISSLAALHSDELATAEGCNRSLQSQLLEAADNLAKAQADHEAQVRQLGHQLGEARALNSQLSALLEAREAKLAALKEHLGHLKHKNTDAERELGAAYKEVASLQAQLADRDEDVASLQDKMCSETHQWGQLRVALQDSLAAKDEEIASLSLQLQRMESALRAVERMLYGCMRKPGRLDRASLDAVSISQLKAAVDNFAAVGDGGAEGASCGAGLLMGPGSACSGMGGTTSPREAEALRVLLQEQVGGGGFAAAHGMQLPGYTDLEVEPGTELPLQDLDRLDQSPRKQPAEAASLAAASSSGPHVAATIARTAPFLGRQCSPVKGRQRAGGSGSAGSARTLLPGCALGGSDDTAVGSSRGARSSATSEGVHRYSADCSDDEGDEGAADQAGAHDGVDAGCAADALADDDCDVMMVCHSMDEQEMQQQLCRLKASASQFSEVSSSLRCSPGGKDADADQQQARARQQRQQQQQGRQERPGKQQQQQLAAASHASLPQRRMQPHTASVSMCQLSPVKEEALQQQQQQQQQ